MSGGLKMLHSDISPSKDNLIFSSLEDLQIPSMDMSANKNHNAAQDSKEKLTRNNSLNLTKNSAKSENKVKTHHRTRTSDHIQVLPDPDALYQARRQHQHNLILVQQQQQQQKSILIRNGSSGGMEGGGVGKGDDHKNDYDTIEEVESQSELGSSEGGRRYADDNGPRVVTVDEEVGSSCCWGFRVSSVDFFNCCRLAF